MENINKNKIQLFSTTFGTEPSKKEFYDVFMCSDPKFLS